MEISRTSQKLHFRVTKKDPGLLIRFHVLNLSKSWSNLGFDQDSNAQKIKKIRKMKTKVHSLLMSYSKHIQVDKQGLNLDL
jgi:hypothetical protein